MAACDKRTTNKRMVKNATRKQVRKEKSPRIFKRQVVTVTDEKFWTL